MALESVMQTELYYPCLKNWDTDKISERVGEAMTFPDAVLYLKKHYSGAWSAATACPQPVDHEYFKESGPVQQSTVAS